MPIFAYACKRRGGEFEQLIQGAAQAVCPSCEGTALEKKLSSFAVAGNAPAGRELMGSCSICGDSRGAGAGAMD